MVNFYVNMILNGRLTLDRVPAKWYEAVREALEAIYAEQQAEEEVQPEEEPAVEEADAEPEAEHDEEPGEPDEQEEEPAAEPVDEYDVGHDDILDDEEEE